MKLNINRHMLEKTGWDSGSITSLSAVMHRFEQGGSYRAEILLGTQIVGRFGLIVDEKSQKTPVKIDLGAIDQPTYTVNPHCYTVFQAPGGSGGFSIVVSETKDGKKVSVFDSRELQNGDIYLAAILLPGHYSFSNQAGASGHIEVVPPEKGTTRFVPVSGKRTMRHTAPEAVSVECTDKLFRPDKIKTQSGQSVLFMIKAPKSRIRIKPEKMDEVQSQKRIPRIKTRLAPKGL